MPKLYSLPSFLEGRVDERTYVRWLRHKCTAHVKRDRKRSLHAINGADYRGKMHAAICASGGRDYYTGEDLAWELIGTYCNEASKAGRSYYKGSMAMLPTIDHVLTSTERYDFVVCAWCTNGAKDDMSHQQFVDLCRRVIAHHDAQSSRLD